MVYSFLHYPHHTRKWGQPASAITTGYAKKRERARKCAKIWFLTNFEKLMDERAIARSSINFSIKWRFWYEDGVDAPSSYQNRQKYYFGKG